LAIEDRADLLHTRYGAIGAAENVVQWPLHSLRDALSKKHKATFWIKANTRGSGDTEEFHYVMASHTGSPFTSNFTPLIEAGLIQVDFVVHIQKVPGRGPRARDHGYLFKMSHGDFNFLFPPAEMHALV
jgi:hypothetical protein